MGKKMDIFILKIYIFLDLLEVDIFFFILCSQVGACMWNIGYWVQAGYLASVQSINTWQTPYSVRATFDHSVLENEFPRPLTC